MFFDHFIVIALHGSKHWSKLKPALCLGLPKTSMDYRVHFFDMDVPSLHTSVNDIMGMVDTCASPRLGSLAWFTVLCPDKYQ
jgi:hypothetical protein